MRHTVKRITKFLWRLMQALGAIGVLGILLPRLITSMYAANRIHQKENAPNERLAIVFGARDCDATGRPPQSCVTGSRLQQVCTSAERLRNC